MKSKFILSFIVVFFSVSVFAEGDNYEQKIKQANDFYAQGNYSQAIELYKQVLDNDMIAFELYYNLGNSYFKNNDLGRAILYYEKAKLLKPANEKNNHNLEFARQQIKNDVEKIPEFFVSKFFRNFVASRSSNFWAIVSITSFILSLSAIVLFLLSPKKSVKKIGFAFAIVLIITSLTTFSFANKAKKLLVGEKYAIVVESAAVKSSPTETGNDIFVLPVGVKVSLQEQSENWYEIKLENGNIGWINSELIEII